MLIRTKSGEVISSGKAGLLEYLGGGNKPGIVKVGGEVELIASVPICKAQPEGMRWTFSTNDLDRYGERIDPQGWDYSRYLANPVVQWAHNYLIPAIGRAADITADDDGLHGVLYFNDKAFDPFGWAIGERVKAGVIRAGSVGFRVLEVEIPDKETAKDGTSLIFRKQELLEFSICNVPANPFALAANMTETMGESSLSRFWGGFINNLEGV